MSDELSTGWSIGQLICQQHGGHMATQSVRGDREHSSMLGCGGPDFLQQVASTASHNLFSGLANSLHTDVIIVIVGRVAKHFARPLLMFFLSWQRSAHLSSNCTRSSYDVSKCKIEGQVLCIRNEFTGAARRSDVSSQ